MQPVRGKSHRPASPEDVGIKRHDDSAVAMVGVLKYGSGMPLYRLERPQENLKNPLAAFTQWDILDAAAIILWCLMPWYLTLHRVDYPQ